MKRAVSKPRIGVYAGTFDPVHAGHLSFALQAQVEANLDEVCFLPERMPRYKPVAEHYGHRVAMLKRAIEPHRNLSLVEVVDKSLTFSRTIPQLKRVFGDVQLVLLMGSDAFLNLPDWPDQHNFLNGCEFVVSVRGMHDVPQMLHVIQRLGLPPKKVTVIDSLQPELSSSQIRRAISLNQTVRGLLPSVQRYAAKQWLYVQVPARRNA